MSVRLTLPLAALVVAAGCATTGDNTDLENIRSPSSDITSITEWDYDSLYETGGIRSDELMGAEVIGANGDEIGNVENVVLNGQNEIIGVIAEVGGFVDIGDTHIIVPWEDVNVTDDGVKVPVSQQNLDQFSLFGEDSPVSQENLEQVARVTEDVNTGPQNWKLSSLLGDYAAMEDDVGYGYVDEAIFTEDGKLQAVIIESAGSPYAYPFYGYGYGWEPGLGTYGLPYGADDIGVMEPFDYGLYGY